MSKQPMPSNTTGYRWELEVVRGREIGRRYALDPGELLIGNALAGARGVDLAGEETNSPRRMAGRQASLTVSGETLTIRDLESPGGTFVNRQRLLAGQARALRPGDVVQVGAVQLQVRSEAARSSTPKPVTRMAPPPPPLQPVASRPPTADVRP